MDTGDDEEVWACDKCTFVNSTDDLTCIMCYQVRTSTKDLAVIWEWKAEDWIPYDLPSCNQIEAAYQEGKGSVKLNKGWFSSQAGVYEVFFGTKAKDADPSKMRKKMDMFQVNKGSGMRREVRRLGSDDNALFQEVPFELITPGDTCSICQELLREGDEEATEAPSSPRQMPYEPPSTSTAPASPAPSTPATSSSGTSASPSSSASSSSSSSSSSSMSSLLKTITATATSLWSSPLQSSVPSTEAKAEGKDASSARSQAPEMMPVKLPKCKQHYFHRHCVAQWVKLKDYCPYCKTPL